MYKIAVYAICKNESRFIERGVDSMSEADYICVLDTGSTDGTYEKLLNYQLKNPVKFKINQAIINPGRFDVARNESMKLIPKDADICVCTDLDEVLIPGWAKDFRAIWDDQCTRLNYLYAGSHTNKNEPLRVFWYNKCHDNSGRYFWTAPVHEYLNDPVNEVVKYLPQQIYLHHYPDLDKSRASYLGLLEQRVKEYPDDYYGKVYLAHEYFYRRHYQKSIDFIKELLKDIHTDEYDCLADLYMFLGDGYQKLNLFLDAEKSYLLGIKASATFRDNYIKLGNLYIRLHKYQDAIHILNDGLLYSRRQYSGLESNDAWGYSILDSLCLAYYYAGAKESSLMYAKAASLIDPTDERLKDNYELIKNELEVK